MISPTTRTGIKGYLEGFIQAMIDEWKPLIGDPRRPRSRPINPKKGDSKPFHEAILPSGILAINEFERSFSTKLGASFEEAAKLIAAQTNPMAVRQHTVSGMIYTEAVAMIESFCKGLDQHGWSGTYSQIVKKVIAVDSGPKEPRSVIMDIYVQSPDGAETYFEIKSPKPNKGQCVEVTKRLLEARAITRDRAARVEALYAMAYNPYGPERASYKHSFALRYLDFPSMVILGTEFWERLGGRGTFAELLSIYQEVGHEKGPDLVDQLLAGY
jgi:hypothetical protein